MCACEPDDKIRDYYKKQVVMIRDLPEYQGKYYAIKDEDEKTLSTLFSASSMIKIRLPL
jgi:hypothetical protein